MAQFRIDTNTLDTTLRTRYEVQMLSDRLTPSGTLTDAFGRLRISQPFTLFDSQNRYEKNDKWSESITGASADATYNANDSTINLNVSTANNDYVIRETKRVFSYQPGKSLLVLSTFAMGTPDANRVERVGYFGANNGVYLERNGANTYFVLRSRTNGSIQETRVPQSQWSPDKFDGAGYSNQSHGDHGDGLDLTKTNILWFDIEWLGVGDIRCGFVVDGRMVPAHIFHNDNLNTTTYMTTATLPIRYEIQNTGPAATSGFLKQICSTVISEGGYEATALHHSVGNEFGAFKDLASANTYYPVVSIRLAPGRLDSVVVPVKADMIGVTNNSAYKYKLILNGTLTGDSWQTSPSSNNVQYDLSASTISGGRTIKSGFLSTSTKGGNLELGSREDFAMQLGRTLSGNSDILTLAIATDTAGSDVGGVLEWIELQS